MLAALLLVSFAFTVNATVPAPSAKEGCGSHECTKCHSLSVKEANDILSFGGVAVKSVKPAPSHGLYEVLFEKDGRPGLVYIDYGKKNLIQGQTINLKTKEMVVAHEQEMPKPKQLTEINPKLIPVQHAFVIGNPKGSKKIYVFTDPDCPFCKTFHTELHKLAKIMPDLSINIMLYPIRQLHPQAYDKSRVVLARKKVDLLDKAFEGKELPAPKGDEGKAGIDAIIAFAQEQGINGTPMMFLPNGKLYQSARDPESMKKAIEGK